MRPWLFRHEASCRPRDSMQGDLILFGSVRSGELPGALRIYNWTEPAVTIGHHQRSFSFHDRGLDLPVLRRPTGGGAVLHVDDITFSMSTPFTSAIPGGVAECSIVISRVFAAALNQCGVVADIHGGSHEFSPVCFARPSPVELVSGTGKIMGLALARKGSFLLAQGVIPLRVDRLLSERVFGTGGLPECMGILDMCPDFSLETFLACLCESLASHLGVRLDERLMGEENDNREDRCNVKPGLDALLDG